MTMIPPPPPSDPTAIPDLGPRFYYPGKEPPDVFEVSGEGFVPGEDVQVAIIRQEVEARMDGRARALVNANELGYARRVILMGAISGTTVLSPVLE
ncbi:MAG: hypothetical protein J0G30_11135 [Actinomycetales bacterium]|nr:hypothetical protein [Actinomycetales bacterium]